MRTLDEMDGVLVDDVLLLKMKLYPLEGTPPMCFIDPTDVIKLLLQRKLVERSVEYRLVGVKLSSMTFVTTSVDAVAIPTYVILLPPRKRVPVAYVIEFSGKVFK